MLVVRYLKISLDVVRQPIKYVDCKEYFYLVQNVSGGFLMPMSETIDYVPGVSWIYLLSWDYYYP